MKLDLFIIGTPKSGTSSLYDWLNAHPEIEGSKPKETFYFMDLENPFANKNSNYNLQGNNGLKKHFSDNSEGKIFFEATTHNFYQETAMNFISSQTTPPLIVIVLRDPTKRIYSSFKYSQNNLATVNKDLTFNSYVDHLINGKHDQLRGYFYSDKSFYSLGQELEFSKYVNLLDKWSTIITRSSIEVIIFEELVNDPISVMQNLCNRVGVSSKFYEEFSFSKQNKTYSVNNQMLQRIAMKFAKHVPRNRIKQKAKKIYYNVQNRLGDTSQDESYDKDALEALHNYFIDWNNELSKRYGCDVSWWEKSKL